MPTAEFLDKAIEAHVQWKMRLSTAILNNETSKLDKSVVCTDTKCELGKWIHGEGVRYAGNADFESLKVAHKHIHESIGKVIDLAGAKRIDDAKMEMRSGDFKKFSSEVVLCISKIKTVVHFKNEKH